MKKIKLFLIIIGILVVLIITVLFLAGYTAPKPAGIRIETSPKASVFINGSLVGETPYEGSYKAGSIILRLVPEGSSQVLIPFETTLTLTSGIETVVGRTFETSEDNSSTYVISFEKNNVKTAGLTVMSQPNNADVVIDGVSRGFSPYKTSAIAPAMHTVAVKSPGYKDFSMTVKTLTDYKLTFYVKLGKGNNQQVSSPVDTSIENKKVTILDSKAGYLRVKITPMANSEEIGEVKSGEIYPYIDTDVATGWVEIQYQNAKPGLPSGIVGWIDGKYASVSSSINNLEN